MSFYSIKPLQRIDPKAKDQSCFIRPDGGIILTFISGFYANGTTDHHEEVARLICEEKHWRKGSHPTYKDYLVEEKGYVSLSLYQEGGLDIYYALPQRMTNQQRAQIYHLISINHDYNYSALIQDIREI